MLYFKKPYDFESRFETVSCIIENYNQILFLQRSQTNSEYPLTWGVPTGKIEKGESLNDALFREILEETSILLSDRPQFVQRFYVRYPDYDFIYHLYHIELTLRPIISLNYQENENYSWEAPEDALKLDLIPDMGECLLHYIKWKKNER